MRPGRGDPCGCGSGKKYKNCCEGKVATRSAAPSPAEVDPLVALYNSGRYAELEGRARLLVGKYPDFGFGWNLLGGSLQMQGKNALSAFKKTAELMPGEADAHYNLGIALKRLGLLDEAIENYTRALKIKPDYAEALGNLGNALKDLGRLADAMDSYRRALSIKPDSAETHNSMGAALKDLGQLEEAVASYRRAVALKPNYADAHFNLGNMLKGLGKFDDAVMSYRHALELRPGFAEAHNNLGLVLRVLGQLDAAENSFQRAVRIKPDYVEALNNLAKGLMTRGEFLSALTFVVQSLRVEDRWETKGLFVNCVLHIRFIHVDGFVRDTMIRALSEPWCRPFELAWVCTDIVKLNQNVGNCMARAVAAWPQRLAGTELYGTGGIANVSNDALLCCFLESAQICDLDMERFLTMARFTLLVAASDEAQNNSIEEEVLSFYTSLAQQCFINEYVFAWTDAEAEQARGVRNRLAAALESGRSIPVLWLLAVACYFPLNEVPFAERLLKRSWPGKADRVLAQQVREPSEEQRIRATIPRLTPIDDEVSLLVQNQYEENPYPRWVRAEPVWNPGTVDSVIRRKFPLSSFRPLGKNVALDILIAGCGTGQQPIDTARSFIGAQLLAIDLSLTSLAYAKRKSQELGLTMIEYAQADIMKLGALDRRFDVIESCGVLHHLADPLAGWRVLLSLLRPGGLMLLGLYSEVARRPLIPAQTFIAERGYGSTAQDIRQCRQELMESYSDTTSGSALKSGDFFSTSACRDLLFHVQEHRMTLTGIDAFLKENDLQFLGFANRPDVFRAYRKRFPEDPAATNLGNWQMFENDNPETFNNMFQFWIQKPG